MSELQPIYGYGFFHVHDSGLVDQTIVFLYSDPGRLYLEISKDPVKRGREIELLARNMQYFLDEERVYINNKRVYPVVKDVDIGVAGLENLAYIVFKIVFKGELRKGLNHYLNEYEEETAEYDYTVYWVFPENARFVRASLNVPYEVVLEGRGVKFTVARGTRLPGREEIVFDLR
ncbi:hypothetical protein WLZ34_01195 [Thermogladius sp. KZ2Tp1]|jgi:hypothetical protein|uniref:hypothetical protein n=1 Tax=unclassified Thermogladius TaxID=2647734 RepID=UPI003D0BA641